MSNTLVRKYLIDRRVNRQALDNNRWFTGVVHSYSPYGYDLIKPLINVVGAAQCLFLPL